MQIGFLGAGKMAQAMARGLLASGKGNKIIVFNNRQFDIKSKPVQKGKNI